MILFLECQEITTIAIPLTSPLLLLVTSTQLQKKPQLCFSSSASGRERKGTFCLLSPLFYKESVTLSTTGILHGRGALTALLHYCAVIWTKYFCMICKRKIYINIELRHKVFKLFVLCICFKGLYYLLTLIIIFLD